MNRQPIEEPALSRAAEDAREPRDRQFRDCADPVDAVERQLPLNGVVVERQRRIERGEMRRHVSRAEIERVVQQDVAVDDFYALNVDGPFRSCAFLLLRFASDQRTQIPSAVGLLSTDNSRSRQANAPNHNARLKELPEAVAERNFIDHDHRLAIARQLDLTEAEAAQQRSFEPADRQGCGEVLIRLTDDQSPDAVFGPARFNGDQDDADADEYDDDDTDQRAS